MDTKASLLLLLASPCLSSPSPFQIFPRVGRNSKVMVHQPTPAPAPAPAPEELDVGQMLKNLEAKLAEVKLMEGMDFKARMARPLVGEEGEYVDPMANELAEEMMVEAAQEVEQKDREVRAKQGGGFDLEHSFSLQGGEQLRRGEERYREGQYQYQGGRREYRDERPQQYRQQYQEYQGQYPQGQASPRQIERGQDQRSGLLNNFGASMGADASTEAEGNPGPTSPQLSPSRQALEDGALDQEEEEEEEEVRCINKVMQVETTVYEDKVKCQHTFTEKCHDTFVTDYIPTQERKCDTSFDKNCHITYKPMMFEEKVEICNEGIGKVCDNSTVGQGEEVCKTHYETTCETRFKEHEVEQDEPVCIMVTERKCKDVRVPVPDSAEGQEEPAQLPDPTGTPARGFNTRQRRSPQGEPQLTGALGGVEGPQSLGGVEGNSLAALGSDQDLLSIGEECEDWPVQKCTLEKKTVKKVNPETSCRKVPRDICAPSNCVVKTQDKVCREENRQLVQNIPSEECDLEPREDCKMETVLVPRLVQQPNCIKVPKEICINVKSNPRKVTKPVVKEWCYKPSDLKAPSTRLALSQFFSN